MSNNGTGTLTIDDTYTWSCPSDGFWTDPLSLALRPRPRPARGHRLRAGGLLVVDGAEATFTLTQEQKNENGSSSSVQARRLLIEGKGCLITD